MIALLAALGAPPVQASPAELHGFGARSGGRADSGVAVADGVSAAYLNPAALTKLDRAQAMAGFSLVRYSFDDLPEVYWDTNRDGVINEADPPLSIVPEYGAADSISLGWGVPVGERFGLGLAAIMPKDRLIRIQTFEPEIPTYFMYANRPQRYALSAGFGWEQIRGLSLGGGVRILPLVKLDMQVTIDAVVSGASEDPQGAEDLISAEVDIHNMTLDMVPGFAPIAALHWDVGEVLPPLEGLSLGGSYRGASGLPIDVQLDAQFNATIEDVGELEPVIIAALADAQLSLYDHYLPAQLNLGIAWLYADTLMITGDARRTAWSKMRLNIGSLKDATLTAPMVDLSDVEITDGNSVLAEFEDTWGYRLSTELRLPRFSLGESNEGRAIVRGGFGYEPSPLVAQGASSALLDADRLLFALGLGFYHSSPWPVFAGPFAWDAFYQHQVLASGALERPEINEPQPGYPVDNAVIPIGGRLIAGGLQLTLDY